MTETREILRALVLQGGGALGAFELGAARVMYGEMDYRPDVISGVSIGAISAVLLARPRGGDPLAALERFWEEVTLSSPWARGPLRAYASAFGNPRFFMPRTDVFEVGSWTNFYSTAPLRQTLTGLVDLDALADPQAWPRLLLTATDIEKGEIASFFSAEGGLTLDHVLASGSLPPSFPATLIKGRSYWDGGVFDNTPLGEVLVRMDRSPKMTAGREIVVVNLFPNAGPVPGNMAEVSQRALNLMFANKTASDLRLLARFNAIAALLDEVREDVRWAELAASDLFAAADRGYIQVPRIVEITRKTPADGADSADFSSETIAARIAEGEAAAREAFVGPHAGG
jgi:predicted acylesterase/phospholipase RssA